MRAATQALTVIAELDRDGGRALVEQRLAAINEEPRTNAVFRPGDLPDTHFMRFVILDDPRGELPALLVWESNHDGRTADYLAAVARAAPAIDNVLACCVDYPAIGDGDVGAWLRWIKAHSYPAGAFYTAYPGVPHRAVRNDRSVAEAIRTVLVEDRDTLGELSPRQIQDHLRTRVAGLRPELDCAPSGDGRAGWLIAWGLAIALGIIALPFALVLGLPWYLALRHRESTDLASAYVRPVDLDPAIRAVEDGRTQNQLTHLVEIKPGVFRLVTLWLVLKGIHAIARIYALRGNLGGITAIHFARWVIVRDRRNGIRKRHRLLFLSNYDGTWESYLGEFIDRAALGLTAIWSNTVGFPATRHLMFAGARAEDTFKQWTREHQLFTQLWWTGTPNASTRNVRDDIWIRQRLGRTLSDAELTAWLRKL